MKINRSLKLDHETISHFVTVLGSGVVEINGNKHATAEFFISARNFIDEYIEKIFFEKEALLIRFLQEIGFSPTGNPISSMIAEQEKSRMLATQFTDAVHLWQEGDEVARTEIAWYAGEYISTLTAHLQRLKTIVIPLLEQNITPEEEDELAEGFEKVVSETEAESNLERFMNIIKMLENELIDWRSA